MQQLLIVEYAQQAKILQIYSIVVYGKLVFRVDIKTPVGVVRFSCQIYCKFAVPVELLGAGFEKILELTRHIVTIVTCFRSWERYRVVHI